MKTHESEENPWADDVACMSLRASVHDIFTSGYTGILYTTHVGSTAV